jgi:hypothetical protein
VSKGRGVDVFRHERAARLFFDTVPERTREVIRRMAKEKNMTVQALIYDVWRERIERWAQDETEEKR